MKLDNGKNKLEDQFFKTEVEIKSWLNNSGIENYLINEDLTVDVNGNVDLKHVHLDLIPLQFNKIDGDFDCTFNELTSLEGSPSEVSGSFRCDFNFLISLEHAPKKVGKNFHCSSNELTTLEGAPEEVSGEFVYFNNDKLNLLKRPKLHNEDLYRIKLNDIHKYNESLNLKDKLQAELPKQGITTQQPIKQLGLKL